MAPVPLVYVHGAGPQQEAAVLKHEVDLLLFGRDMPSTRVAYYADVRWKPAPTGLTLGPGEPLTDARDDAVNASADPALGPKAAAAAIIAAAMESSVQDDGLTTPSAPAGERAGDSVDAQRLVERLYRRADRIASRSSVGPTPMTFGISFPDPIFRIVVGRFASDVVDYLYGPYKATMREPVRQALRLGPPPRVIVAHSLGTIILYDILSEPEFAGLKVDLLVTVGCPLGIGNVQDRLRDRAGKPNPVPTSLAAWSNFADRWDPVALDPTMHDSFRPPVNFARDAEVNNPAPNNHDLTGYLSVGIVKSAIAAAAGSVVS